MYIEIKLFLFINLSIDKLFNVFLLMDIVKNISLNSIDRRNNNNELPIRVFPIFFSKHKIKY